MKKPVKILKICGLALLGLVLAVVLLLGALTLWLTSERLTDLANRQLSSYLNADIHTKNITYTLWSTFPRFHISTDSIVVISRNLKDTPAKIRRQLPGNTDSLGSLKSFSGSINVVDLFLNRYVIHDIKIDGLNLNLVAFNDSLNNYNILPAGNEQFKRIPYFSIHKLSLLNPGKLSYFSAATKTQAGIDLAAFDLNEMREHKKPKDYYHLALKGKVNASSAGIRILTGFPISMAGDLSLRFNPFGIKLMDYDIDLGSIRSKLNMSMGIGDSPSVDEFNYHISSVSLMSLLSYLPKEFLPSLQGIEADMQLSASATLASAWNLSSESFPRIKINFDIPSGEMVYSFAQSNSNIKKYPLSYSHISGIFFFDGITPNKSYLNINPFKVSAEGTDVNLQADVSNLTTLPLVETRIGIASNLEKALKYIGGTSPVALAGNLTLDSNIRFNISDFSLSALKSKITNLKADASLRIPQGRIKIPKSDVSISFSGLSVRMADHALSLNAISLDNPGADATIKIAEVNGTTKEGSFFTKNLNIKTAAGYTGDAAFSVFNENFSKDFPFDFVVSAAEMAYIAPEGKAMVRASNCSIFPEKGVHPASELTPAETILSDGLAIAADSICIDIPTNQGGHTLLLDNPALCVATGPFNHAAYRSTPATLPAPKESYPDSIIPHSPELLAINSPRKLRAIIAALPLRLYLKTSRLDIRDNASMDESDIRNIDIALCNDTILIYNTEMDLAGTRAITRAEITNIRNFLTLPASENNPLGVKLDAAFDTININALAKSYVDSKGGMHNIPKHAGVTASDSTAMMIPRNILSDLTLSARETAYMNLRLYNLATNIKTSGGALHIPQLDISSDFGRAALSLNYDTSDITDMNIDADLNITNVNIVNFFKNFHTLLLMMPQMSNLTGVLSAGVSARANIFPDMYLNVPSANCDLKIRGRELKVHQSKFIRKITKMMLIRTDDDIHIKDLDVHAAVHDNLLQLDPFNFEFDRYKLNMVGINNFNGNLYYHLAVLKSPVPFPFSVNIQGLFRHPELTFGGPKYDLKHSERITSEILQETNVNIVAVFHRFLREFIRKAAESAENPNITAQNSDSGSHFSSR